MNLKKIIALGLSLGIAIGSVGCSKRTEVSDETPNNNNTSTNQTTDDNNSTSNNKYMNTEYAKQYNTLYNENLIPLGNYSMYQSIDDINNVYKNEKYPGNEKYLADVKAAYTDSRDKIQSFVNGLANTKTDDKDLQARNKKLIDEGNNAIKDIDERINKLGEITTDDYNKSQDEFIKLVYDTGNTNNNMENAFNNMIKDMNKMLGINTDSNNNTK